MKEMDIRSWALWTTLGGTVAGGTLFLSVHTNDLRILVFDFLIATILAFPMILTGFGLGFWEKREWSIISQESWNMKRRPRLGGFVTGYVLTSFAFSITSVVFYALGK